MQKDALRPLLARVEQRCLEKGIEVFYGDIEAGMEASVQWNKSGQEDWKHFLQILTATGQKLLIVTTCENNLDLADTSLADFLEGLPEELVEEYRSALNTVTKTQGELACLTFSFFKGPICFQLQKTASWYEEYQLISDALDAEEDDQDIPTQYKGMPPEQIEEWARKLILDPRYQKAKDRMERGRIASVLFEKEGIDNHAAIFKILRRAEGLFEEEIRPSLERDLREKVKELKQQGLKKVEIRSKLGITERTLNRHWY